MELHARKAKITRKGLLKVILVKTQKEKRRAVEKAFILFDEIIMNRMLVEIGMVKAILMKPQTEMRNMLLNSREKAIRYNVAKNWTKSCSHSSVL